MLIEFSIANFRSFRERQTLSMVAAPRMHKRENVFKPVIEEKNFPDLLKAAVIYGPNASGKSNLLKALEVLETMALRTPNHSKPLPVSPFRFDPDLVNKPSVFEVHFIHQAMRYRFDLAMTADRIHRERLCMYPKGKETLLYDRAFVDGQEVYDFGLTMEGGEALINIWKNLTPPAVLFLVQAVNNSSEELKQLRQPYEWFLNGLRSYLDGMNEMSKYVKDKVTINFPESTQDISSLLRDIDVPVTQLKVEETPNHQAVEVDSQAVDAKNKNLKALTKATFTYRTALGEADFSYDEQSEGTKNLIGFWLPWYLKINNEIDVLVVDELDTSLHPLIVQALVKKHLQEKKPSQLIFTTHDTHLMDAKVLRRDQFWITERDMNGATRLRCVHEFEGRDNEDLEKRYYEGRYRGLPFVKAES